MKDISTKLNASNLSALLSLFDNIHDGVMVVDENMRIGHVNRSAASLFGYEPSELQGESLHILLPERFRNPHQSFTHSFMQKPATREMQPLSRLTGLTKNGDEIPVSISLNPVQMTNSIHIMAIIRDMREWDNMEISLASSKKMAAIASLASGISHNFNNIVTAISGNIYLAKKLATNDAQKTYLDEVMQLSQHASAVVGQLLGYARDAQKGDRRFCFNTVIAETVRACNLDLPEGTELLAAAPDGNIYGHGDPDLVRQVLHNIVKNAIHAVENSPIKKVKLDLYYLKRSDCRFGQKCDLCQSDAIQISVADTGKGIDSKHLGKIFDPFFTTKEKHKGTGLGLSMSLGAIRAHGGNIFVESQPGSGSTFTVCLPAK